MPASNGISSGIFNTLGVPASAPGGITYVGLPRSIGLAGVNLGGAPSWDGESSFGRVLQVGAQESLTIGYLSAPSLQLNAPGFWRLRWTVTAGTHTVSVYVMQSANVTPYPSIIVKKNPAIGVNSDVTGTSPGGAGWVQIGPVTISPTSEGVVWVQLWNNLNLPTIIGIPGGAVGSPCYFGQITVT